MLIKTIVLYLGNVAVECVSCAGGSSELSGVVGRNITIRYTFNISMMTIYYNGTHNTITILQKTINRDEVADQRFIIPHKLSGTGNRRSIDIILTNLSINDNNVEFTYQYTNVEAKKFEGQNKITVYGTYFLFSIIYSFNIRKKVK